VYHILVLYDDDVVSVRRPSFNIIIPGYHTSQRLPCQLHKRKRAGMPLAAED
jgi:hypothetical protein